MVAAAARAVRVLKRVEGMHGITRAVSELCAAASQRLHAMSVWVYIKAARAAMQVAVAEFMT
jgi:hypothetical protein